jgi:hypothetical protein
MTWKQIRVEAEKQGLSCKQVYELVVAQKTHTKTGSHEIYGQQEEYMRGVCKYCSGKDACLGCDCKFPSAFLGRKLRAGA